MQGRPHAERLRFDLDEIRGELAGTIRELGPEAFDQAPGPDMKTCKQLLQEIGTIEEVSRRWITQQEIADWGTVWQELDKPDAGALVSALEEIRAKTLDYLAGCTEEQLQTPIPLPPMWYQYFGGATVIEPEELVRWIAKHEYYHLGQLYTYLFLRAAGSPAAKVA